MAEVPAQGCTLDPKITVLDNATLREEEFRLKQVAIVVDRTLKVLPLVTLRVEPTAENNP